MTRVKMSPCLDILLGNADLGGANRALGMNFSSLNSAWQSALFITDTGSSVGGLVNS